MTTNGIDGGTNGIHADSPLADVLDELRNYADDLRYDYNPLDGVFEPDERLGELCGEAADMLEAKRDAVDDDAYMRGLMAGRASLDDEFAELTAERDEWKAKAEGFAEALEKLGCSVLANGTVFGPTEAKSAKRAAAVERLRTLDAYTAGPESIVDELARGLDTDRFNYHVEIEHIIDLLSDDSVNDDLPPETGVKATDVDANDANATHDSREKLESDVRKHYSHTVSTLLFPPSANKTTDMLMSLPVDTVLGWLDRQEAITKGEWCTERGWWDSAEECNRATALCHEKDERIAELQAEIDKRDRGIARLKRQRDEARAELGEIKGVSGRLEAALDAVEGCDERCMGLERERDMWRMRCGELLDAAHGLQGIADGWEE